MDVWEITTINQTPPYKNKSVDFYDISNFLCVSAISDIQPQRARCSCIAQKNTCSYTLLNKRCFKNLFPWPMEMPNKSRIQQNTFICDMRMKTMTLCPRQLQSTHLRSGEERQWKTTSVRAQDTPHS